MRIVFCIACVLLTRGSVSATNPANCIQGRWELTNYQYQRDGSVSEGRALSDRHCLSAGVAMDEYRSLDADGKVNFLGVSFQVQHDNDVAILWAMVGDPGFTSIHGQFAEDGSLETTGSGEDMLGLFDEQFVMRFRDDGLSYDMEMGRKYAQWGNWIMPFNRIEASYSTPDVPRLPETAVPQIVEAAAPALARDPLIILDGWALASISTGVDEVTIQYSSRYAAPDRWRTLTWSSRTGEVTASERLIAISD